MLAVVVVVVVILVAVVIVFVRFHRLVKLSDLYRVERGSKLSVPHPRLHSFLLNK
jgi:hypothetical protein